MIGWVSIRRPWASDLSQDRVLSSNHQVSRSQAPNVSSSVLIFLHCSWFPVLAWLLLTITLSFGVPSHHSILFSATPSLDVLRLNVSHNDREQGTHSSSSSATHTTRLVSPFPSLLLSCVTPPLLYCSLQRPPSQEQLKPFRVGPAKLHPQPPRQFKPGCPQYPLTVLYCPHGLL